MSTSQTRYILSSVQQNFLYRLQNWLNNLNYSSLISPDTKELMEYRSLITKILKNDGYDEDDSFIINWLRIIYIRDKDTLRF